jgi:hypothetical protein
MPPANKTRLLQTAVALFALIPIGAGFSGIWLGPELTDSVAANVSLDSHFAIFPDFCSASASPSGALSRQLNGMRRALGS